MNELDITKCGVYVIKNKVNGKVYIGSTIVTFKKRWQDHLKHLKEVLMPIIICRVPI